MYGTVPAASESLKPFAGSGDKLQPTAQASIGVHPHCIHAWARKRKLAVVCLLIIWSTKQSKV